MSIIPQTLQCSLKQPPGVQLCFLESQELAKPLDFPQSKPVSVGKAIIWTNFWQKLKCNDKVH